MKAFAKYVLFYLILNTSVFAAYTWVVSFPDFDGIVFIYVSFGSSVYIVNYLIKSNLPLIILVIPVLYHIFIGLSSVRSKKSARYMFIFNAAVLVYTLVMSQVQIDNGFFAGW